jgi:hypothetical protein
MLSPIEVAARAAPKKQKKENEKERLSLTNPCGLEGISAFQTAGGTETATFFLFYRNYFVLSHQIPLLYQYSTQSFSPANHQLGQLADKLPNNIDLRYVQISSVCCGKDLQRSSSAFTHAATRGRQNKLAVLSPKLFIFTHAYLPTSLAGHCYAIDLLADQIRAKN